MGRMIQIPVRLPYLRLFTIIWAVYSLLWISLEGNLTHVIILGVLTTAVSLLHLIQKYLTSQTLSAIKWNIITAVSGYIAGFSCSLLTLIFMAIKTGLHAHGPEFTRSELSWVLQQLPLWSISGLLLGLGVGLMITAIFSRNP